MSKAYSKAAKRRAKKNRAPLPELAQTPRPKKRGGARMREIAPDKLVLETRARRMGSANPEHMRSQMLGEDAGMALHLECNPAEAAALWQHYTAITGAEAAYHRSLGKSIHAKTAKIEMEPERIETREDHTPDLRSQDERDRAAVNRWMHWQGIIGRLSAPMQTDIQAVVRGRVEVLAEYYETEEVEGKEVEVRKVKATPAGKRFVEAMRALGMGI